MSHLYGWEAENDQSNAVVRKMRECDEEMSVLWPVGYDCLLLIHVCFYGFSLINSNDGLCECAFVISIHNYVALLAQFLSNAPKQWCRDDTEE